MKHEKIAPALLVAHEDYVEDGVEGLGRHVRLLGLAHVDDTPREPESIVFLECLPNASLSGLADEGVRINQTSGELRTAAVPLSALEALSNHPGIRRVVPSRFLRPSMDLALPACGVPAFRNQHGVDGRGVVVAVIDSGIDPGHLAFNGRISKVWDRACRARVRRAAPFPMD
ncbi:MAG TPA: hypothetical protein VJV79_13480 [Polyangiaceae bacterium]|nr:hypothetical protein [Polyangiaceae bacterium]